VGDKNIRILWVGLMYLKNLVKLLHRFDFVEQNVLSFGFVL
jgi:hypothetical protein